MLRRFGNLLTTQNREITVLNYSKHLVYAIWTNNGYLYVAQNKETKKIEFDESVTLVDVGEAIMTKKVEMK